MIHNKFSFFIGVCCSFCFLINILNGRDTFTIVLAGIAAISNLLIGLFG